MEFRTKVDIPVSEKEINHKHKILMLGSCFSDNIGDKLLNGGFDVTSNPLGTLYNPLSIATALSECSKNIEEQNPIFFKWLHSKANLAWSQTTSPLDFDIICITFGTAWIYRLKENGMIVANCKKQPDKLFIREKLSVEAIIDNWCPILNQHEFKKKYIIFTVSPIRHKKDGFHENQLSKSTLLLAINELCKLYPNNCEYFPSYEIVMDELRDYRFYADDMMHPSATAINYIWKRFQETYFSEHTKQICSEFEKKQKQSQHIQIVTQ